MSSRWRSFINRWGKKFLSAETKFVAIPDNVVLHELKQRNGKFIVHIFEINGNSKEKENWTNWKRHLTEIPRIWFHSNCFILDLMMLICR